MLSSGRKHWTFPPCFPSVIYKWNGLQSIYIHSYISDFLICKSGVLSCRNMVKEVKHTSPYSHKNLHIYLLQELQIAMIICFSALIDRNSSILFIVLIFLFVLFAFSKIRSQTSKIQKHISTLTERIT